MLTSTPPFTFAPSTLPIPLGTFEMGSTADDKFANLLERPRHVVEMLHRFEMGACPVTFAQWDAYADAVPGAHRPAGPFGRGQLPVVNVSHDDAVAYCRWLTDATGDAYRLPAEAEWEFCCRAGTAGVFHTGNNIALSDANYFYSEIGEKIGRGRPTPVGTYPANAFGLFDTHGNVNELVADFWHDGYHGAPADGSAWVDDPPVDNALRVLRGGSWDYLPRLLRAAYRDWIDRARRMDNVGFRVAKDA